MKPTNTARVMLENINHPGSARSADTKMYRAMKHAFLKVLPGKSPGLTVAEVEERVLPHLPQDLYPDGAKAGWWTKAVQLDLEAKSHCAGENHAAALAQGVTLHAAFMGRAGC